MTACFLFRVPLISEHTTDIICLHSSLMCLGQIRLLPSRCLQSYCFVKTWWVDKRALNSLKIVTTPLVSSPHPFLKSKLHIQYMYTVFISLLLGFCSVGNVFKPSLKVLRKMHFVWWKTLKEGLSVFTYFYFISTSISVVHIWFLEQKKNIHALTAAFVNVEMTFCQCLV